MFWNIDGMKPKERLAYFEKMVAWYEGECQRAMTLVGVFVYYIVVDPTVEAMVIIIYVSISTKLLLQFRVATSWRASF